MNPGFNIPPRNLNTDHPAETIQNALDTLTQAIQRLRTETADLEREKAMSTLHLQQYDSDLEELRRAYKMLKSQLERSQVFPPPPTIPVSSRPLASLAHADVNWSVDSPNPFFQRTGVRLKYALSLDSVLCAVRFNRDGSLFAFSDGANVFLLATADGSLVGSCEIPQNARQEESPARAICFSPDGQFIAVAAPLHSITVFEVATRRLVTSLDTHKHHVSSLAFFRDSRTMLSGGFDGKLCVWSVPDFRLHRLVPHGVEGSVGKEEMIVAIALGSDDEFIAVGFMNGTIGMYDQAFSQPMSSFQGHQQYLLNVVVSPQDMIATASHDKTAKLWTLRGVASCRQTLRGHSDYVLAIAFAPEDPVVFTGSKDEKLKCWNQKTGECLFTLSGPRNTLFQLDHHPRERTFVSCSGDGLVCVWDYDLP
jgi:hypothetical protein